MSFDYGRMRATADRLLDRFDQGGVLVRGAWQQPDQLYAINLVARGVSAAMVDGTTILMSDIQVVFSIPAGVTPQPTDFIRMDGIDYAIVQLSAVPAAGVKVVYKAIVRR